MRCFSSKPRINFSTPWSWSMARPTRSTSSLTVCRVSSGESRAGSSAPSARSVLQTERSVPAKSFNSAASLAASSRRSRRRGRSSGAMRTQCSSRLTRRSAIQRASSIRLKMLPARWRRSVMPAPSSSPSWTLGCSLKTSRIKTRASAWLNCPLSSALCSSLSAQSM